MRILLVGGGRFDVGILDWELPDLDGIAVLQAWRTVTTGEVTEKLTDRELVLLLELARHLGKLEKLPSPGIAITSVRKVGFQLEVVA